MSAPSEPQWVIHVDGASLGNPGPAGIGAWCTDAQGRVVAQLSKHLGETTNNVAEYLALVYALQYARQRGIERVLVRTDSELMARQLNGEYKVRDGTLRLLYDLASTLRDTFASCGVQHVRREFNTGADRLAGQGAKARFDPALKIVAGGD